MLFDNLKEKRKGVSLLMWVNSTVTFKRVFKMFLDKVC